jgi:hypothetical protein
LALIVAFLGSIEFFLVGLFFCDDASQQWIFGGAPMANFSFLFFFSFFASISTHVFLFFPALTFFLLSLLYLEPIFGLVKFSRFNHKVMIRKFRSCHLVLWLLENLMVYKSPSKETTFAKKRRITS